MFQSIFLVEWLLLDRQLCISWIFINSVTNLWNQIKKRSVSLKTFASDTRVAINLHLPGLEKKHLALHKDPYTLFLEQILIFSCSNQRTFGDIWASLYQQEYKTYLHWSIIGKMITHMGRSQAKWGLGCWWVWFVSHCRIANTFGDRHRRILEFSPSFMFGNSISNA